MANKKKEEEIVVIDMVIHCSVSMNIRVLITLIYHTYIQD